MPNFTWVSKQNGWLPADYFSFKRVISGPRRFTSGCWTVDGCGGVELWCVFFLWVLVFHTFFCTSFWWNTCRPWLNSLIINQRQTPKLTNKLLALFSKPFFFSPNLSTCPCSVCGGASCSSRQIPNSGAVSGSQGRGTVWCGCVSTKSVRFHCSSDQSVVPSHFKSTKFFTYIF